MVDASHNAASHGLTGPSTSRSAVSTIADLLAGAHLARRPRRPDQGQRLGGIEPPVIERAAGNRAGEVSGARLKQLFHVLDRAEPAGGDHRHGDRFGERDGGVEVEALEQAVAGNVGVDDGGDAGVLEAPRDVERGHLRGLRPALDRDLAVAGIEPDRDAAGKLARRRFDQLRIAHRRGADDDAVDALAEPALDRSPCRGCRRRAAPGSDGLEDALDRLAVDRLAGEGAVEIDDVQIFEALVPRRPCACAAGSALNTVARAMSPCCRRTHWPSLRSIAGKRITASTSGNWRSARSPSRWLFSG